MKNYELQEKAIAYNDSLLKYFYTIMPLQYTDVESHCHQHMELILIAKGTIAISLENSVITAKEGDLVIFPPNQIHEWHCGPTTVEYHCIQFNIERLLNQTPTSVKYLMPIIENDINYIPLISDPEINTHIEELIFMQNIFPDSLYTLSKIYFLLALLNERCIKNSPVYVSDKKFAEILKYINVHFNEKLTTKELSEKYAYNESYFCRRFKAVTGITFKNYILNYRLDRASNLLFDTKHDIGEIAYMCGFSDFSYFCSNFKKRFNYTPSEYRKMVKENKI